MADDQKDWGAAGQVDRSQQVQELQDHPELLNRLHNMIHGEVSGSSPPEVRRIQMESAFNRAGDRGHSMEQVLRQTYRAGDSGYYPGTTYNRRDYGNYSSEDFLGDLKAVAGGSNYGGKYMPEGVLHTGNASGDVARHQYSRGTPGFTIQTAGGPESYFAEPGASGRTPTIAGHNTGLAPEDAYNTVLPEFAEKGFQSWMKTQSKTTGRDLKQDLHDYDLRGYFRENGAVNLSGVHLTDKYKKPNHPTFSSNSIYQGIDGHEGGQWIKDKSDGSWDFYAGPTNRANMSDEALKGYFDQVEPGNRVHLHADEGTSKEAAENFEYGSNDVGTAFMRGGRVPKVGELSSAPSKNIEDRTKMSEERIRMIEGVEKLKQAMSINVNKRGAEDKMEKSLGSEKDIARTVRRRVGRQ
jgi:hypothetical protein